MRLDMAALVGEIYKISIRDCEGERLECQVTDERIIIKLMLMI
jgi:hypothetical protein